MQFDSDVIRQLAEFLTPRSLLILSATTPTMRKLLQTNVRRVSTSSAGPFASYTGLREATFTKQSNKYPPNLTRLDVSKISNFNLESVPAGILDLSIHEFMTNGVAIESTNRLSRLASMPLVRLSVSRLANMSSVSKMTTLESLTIGHLSSCFDRAFPIPQSLTELNVRLSGGAFTLIRNEDIWNGLPQGLMKLKLHVYSPGPMKFTARNLPKSLTYLSLSGPDLSFAAKKNDSFNHGLKVLKLGSNFERKGKMFDVKMIPSSVTKFVLMRNRQISNVAMLPKNLLHFHTGCDVTDEMLQSIPSGIRFLAVDAGFIGAAVRDILLPSCLARLSNLTKLQFDAMFYKIDQDFVDILPLTLTSLKYVDAMHVDFGRLTVLKSLLIHDAGFVKFPQNLVSLSVVTLSRSILPGKLRKLRVTRETLTVNGSNKMRALKRLPKSITSLELNQLFVDIDARVDGGVRQLKNQIGTLKVGRIARYGGRNHGDEPMQASNIMPRLFPVLENYKMTTAGSDPVCSPLMLQWSGIIPCHRRWRY